MAKIPYLIVVFTSLWPSLHAAEPFPLEPMPLSYGQRPIAATLEFCAANVDLIVAGTITELSKPEVRRCRLPYAEEDAADRRIISGKCAVSRVYADRQSAFKSKTGVQTDGKIVSFIFDSPSTGDSDKLDKFYLDLTIGDTYILMLQKMPVGDDYYLPARSACALPTTKNFETIEASVKKAIDIDNWAWGVESKGLQMALIATPLPYSTEEVVDNRYMLSFVLRNRSAKPISLCLYPLDTSFSAVAAGENGKSLKMNTIRDELLQLPRRSKNNNLTLQPGQILFFDRHGKTDGVSWSSLWNLPEGRWRLAATFEFKQPLLDGGRVAESVWTGRLQSSEVPVP